MTQPAFHWYEPTLPCAFGQTGVGWSGPHHCRACSDAVDAACESMRQARARGEYDADGYTTNERRALRRRVA